MPKISISPTYAIILILVLIILWFAICNKPAPTNVDKTTTTEQTSTKIDTLWITKTEYVPKWKIKTVHDTIPFIAKTDTASILKNYFAIYTYSDTVKRDSAKVKATAIINDSISQNKIISRNVAFNILYPVVTTTIANTTVKNVRQLYLGGFISGNKTAVTAFGPSLSYKDKKNYLYDLGVGLIGPNSPSVSVGFKMLLRTGK